MAAVAETGVVVAAPLPRQRAAVPQAHRLVELEQHPRRQQAELRRPVERRAVERRRPLQAGAGVLVVLVAVADAAVVAGRSPAIPIPMGRSTRRSSKWLATPTAYRR